MIDLEKLKKMKNLKISLLMLQLIWPLLGLLMSASLLIITSSKSKGSVQFQNGMAVNAEVQAYAAIIAQKAEEHGISEYAVPGTMDVIGADYVYDGLYDATYYKEDDQIKVHVYVKLVDCLEKCLIYGHIRRVAD